MKEKYLPIGSVVILHGGQKALMITGYCTVPNSQQNIMFDYSGCLYPEGFMTSNQAALFNHDQIEKICFLGYETDEEKQYNQKLQDIMKNIKILNSNTIKASNNVDNSGIDYL